MKPSRPIHPDFQFFLDFNRQEVIDQFCDLRNYVLELYPDSNELFYQTHALTAVFSISEKLSDAFCHIPVYTEHMNLGFNKGALLPDPFMLLKGTGKLIRHIKVKKASDYRNPQVKTLIEEAIAFALTDMEKASTSKRQTISKIKKK